MDEPGTEAKRRIVKLLFPDLRYGGDPDVERYFESRKEGRVAQALAIYNGALRVRYPEDGERIELLRLYRENDPRYSSFQERLLLGFASSLSFRIRANIDLITAPLERADLSDALRALKAVESILSRLPGDADGATGLLSRYCEFAQALGYRQALVRRAMELVREYDAVSRADAPADYDFVARSAALEERRRASAGGRSVAGKEEESYDFVSRSAELEERRKKAAQGSTSYFDPSRIRFSEADRSRVEISSALKRREDKVLAFCAKYWPHALDQAFERTVFLYSRKYGGRHFEIFRAIKAGRARGASDDEILSAVSAILTTSYSYSVSGDLYMQVMWRRIRARMQAEAVAERLAEPGPESRVRARRAAYQDGSRAVENELGVPAIPPPPAGDEEPTRFTARQGKPTAPPAFALREASGRARSGDAEGKSPAKAAPPAKPARIAAAKAAAPAKAVAQAKAVTPATPARAAGPAAAKPAAKGKAAIPARPVAPIRPAAKAATATAKKGSAAKRGTASARPAKRAETAAPKPSLRPVAKPKGANLLGRTRVGPEPVSEIRAKHGSISDAIRKLSGKTYDVYKDIFLERVRDVIHRQLLASQTRSHGIFDTAANDAEDHIYGFIAAHYDDPFMDWEHSAERELVESLGFSVPRLEPIVEACFRKL
jgi:hypothetical protein